MLQRTAIQGEYLVDSYALSYLHSGEVVSILPLILSKFKIHVSKFSLYEFLSFIFYKTRNPQALSQLCDLLFKLYVVEELDVEVIKHSAMLLADLLKHGVTASATDVFNVSIAIVKNLVILTDDTSRYNTFTKYGLVAIPIREFVEKFRSEILKDKTTI